MRNFIKALPHELFEAARIDGTSEFNIFIRIVLPLTRPAIAALSVLIFTFIWNDYFWATVLIQGQHAMPITAGLKSLNGQWISSYHLLLCWINLSGDTTSNDVFFNAETFLLQDLL